MVVCMMGFYTLMGNLKTIKFNSVVFFLIFKENNDNNMRKYFNYNIK